MCVCVCVCIQCVVVSLQMDKLWITVLFLQKVCVCVCIQCVVVSLVSLQMDKVKAKAKAWEAEFQRTCQPKKVVSIGCVWTGMVEKTVEDDTFLSQFSALVLTEAPVRIELTTTSSQPESQGAVANVCVSFY